MTKPSWRDDPDTPYAILLGVIETYCHPSAWEEAYEQLQDLARDPGDEEMQVFKRELREAIFDPRVLPEGDLEFAAQYSDGSDEKFLARLWRDLYPEEPLPTA